MRISNLIIAVLFVFFFVNNLYSQTSWEGLPKVEIYQLWELEVENNKAYADPFRDVELRIQLKNKLGQIANHFGFYDGGNKWKIRFSPDELSEWKYEYWFTDDNKKTSGEFGCISSGKSGRVWKNSYNPFWLGKGHAPQTMFKSFQTGDRFFAENWDDPMNLSDGNKRTAFLDWIQENGYNMLSIGSTFSNRNQKNRGEGWNTPKLWPIVPGEYKKLESIMDELKQRDITVFPFAGLFGQYGEWPVEWKEQQVYIRYFLARLGHYPNLILNIAGPEPLWVEQGFKDAMRLNDLKRIGTFIDSVDVHNHVLTVHNETRASQFGDPFIDEHWCDMSTIQGPKTFNTEILFSGLIMNHRPTKVNYAHETLWTGNIYHPKYTNDRIRKNTFAILFSGSILNFADNNGNSSTGFSGAMDVKEANQEKHDIVSAVHNWFATIPFYRMSTRQDIVRQGYCLASEGEEYYIYLDTIGKVEIFLDFPYPFHAEWINAKNTKDIRALGIVKTPSGHQHSTFNTPDDGDDWILHLSAGKPEVVAQGNFPDLAVDQAGNIHLVYNRAGLRYKKYETKKGQWTDEAEIGCPCEYVERADPDVVIDSKGNPHVYCGNEYAWFDGVKWNKAKPKGSRDSELAINSKDQLFLVSRGGNFKGNIGLETRQRNAEWSFLPDPDENGKSINNHVYTDLFVDGNNTLHLIQRHGPVREITYRRSTDNGLTWPIEEAISDDRGESPKIVAGKTGHAFVSTASGYILERNNQGVWKDHGRRVTSGAREMPELGIDKEDNIYLTSFGGRYNTCLKGKWMGEKLINQVSDSGVIGFVKTAAWKEFVCIVWEEGQGNEEEGLHEDASIIIGYLYPDGRIVGLK